MSDREVAAEALFQEGKKLAEGKQFGVAAEKFAASFQLDRAWGPLFNLAHCHEQLGRTATAWAEFREAVSIAAAGGRKERAEAANERAKALEPRLTRLHIVVDEPPPGLTITRNGKAVEPLTWGAAVPVDPGTYVFEASAPGRIGQRVSVLATGAGQTVDVRIPALAVVEAPFGQRHRGSLITLGVTAALAGAAGGFGAWALASHAGVSEKCKGLGGTDCVANELQGKVIATDVLAGAAGAAAVTAVVLFFGPERKKGAPAAVGPATGMPLGVVVRF